jgi:perosamine synthetase
METVDLALADRARLAAQYHAALAPLSDRIVLPAEEPWARHVYWMYSIYLREGDGQRRDAVIQGMDELGIETRPVFHPMHVLPPYLEHAAYPVADSWAQRGISLPTHSFVSELDVRRIVETLAQVIAAV